MKEDTYYYTTMTATDYTVQTLELKLKVSEFGQLCLHYYCAYNVSIAHIVLILIVLGFHYLILGGNLSLPRVINGH